MLYAVLSLTVVRMLPVALAMLGTGARRPTVAFLGWFGPRGLASIVFAVILIDDADLPHLRTLLLAIAVTIAISVYAHGLTAQSADRALRRAGGQSHPRDAQPADGERARRRAPPAHGRAIAPSPSPRPLECGHPPRSTCPPPWCRVAVDR